MEVSLDVRIGLANIRPTLHLRWNPLAKVLREWDFDANGNARKKVHDPRWELWDTDETGRTYKVMTFEGNDGEFLPQGSWMIEAFQLINPANYDGDIHKMIEALVDKPNAKVDQLKKEEYENLVEYMADLTWSEKSRGSRVAVPGLIIPQPVVR